MHIIPYEPHNKNQSGGYMVEAILMDEGARREQNLMPRAFGGGVGPLTRQEDRKKRISLFLTVRTQDVERRIGREVSIRGSSTMRTYRSNS